MDVCVCVSVCVFVDRCPNLQLFSLSGRLLCIDYTRCARMNLHSFSMKTRDAIEGGNDQRICL